MEREHWDELYALILRLGKRYPGGWKYPCSTIVAIYFWANRHHESIAWACRRENWSGELRPPAPLPKQDRSSRRIWTPAVQRLIAAVEAALAAPPTKVKVVDSKPLTVNVCSKDVDAKWGRATQGCLMRGYKLHVVWGGGPLPAAWSVTPLNAQDGKAARPLLAQLTGRGYVLGDGQYDQVADYDVAAEHGRQLIALGRHPHAGAGHRRKAPRRSRGLRWLKRCGDWVRRRRGEIERCFAALTTCGGGLVGLPGWVRTLRRVTLWVRVKLIFNAVRIKHLRPTPANA